MAEVTNASPRSSKGPKALTAQDAARSKAAFLKKAFEEGKGKAATPSQISESKSAMEKLGRIEEWINDHANVLAFYPPEKYDLHSEKSRMCVALYILKNMREISVAAKEMGDHASYSLFISTAKSAEEVLSPNFFLSDHDGELMHRFLKVQPHFEACASAFGTASLSFQEVQDKFSFILGGLVNERRKTGIA